MEHNELRSSGGAEECNAVGTLEGKIQPFNTPHSIMSWITLDSALGRIAVIMKGNIPYCGETNHVTEAIQATTAID